jgi:hypothetical protein
VTIDEVMENSISNALIGSHVEDHEKSIPRYGCENCPLNTGKPFDGIFARLSNDCAGNVHERGLVKITSSGDGQGSPWEVTNPDWNSHWWGCGSDTPWICFDFVERSVALTDYSLKAAEIRFDFLRKWEIEGSNDGSNWNRIDEQTTRELCQANAVNSWHIGHRGAYYRFLRLRQTGVNSGGTMNLNLTRIEFFGVMKMRFPSD